MYNRLIEFINENSLLCEHQFGFRKGKSTSMALVTLIDKVTEALDKGEYIIGVFLDFSKAFDTVHHDVLLQKLTLYGIQDVLKWFTYYLSNRVHYVTYNVIKSMRESLMWSSTRFHTWASLIFDVYQRFMSSVISLLASLICWWYKFIYYRYWYRRDVC